MHARKVPRRAKFTTNARSKSEPISFEMSSKKRSKRQRRKRSDFDGSNKKMNEDSGRLIQMWIRCILILLLCTPTLLASDIACEAAITVVAALEGTPEMEEGLDAFQSYEMEDRILDL